MAYKKVNFMDVYDVIRRWHDNQNVTHISEATSLSRKTVRKYIAIAEKLGISREDALPTKDKIVKKLEPFLNNTNKKPAPVQSVLTEYLDEIDKLVNDSENPLRPKMAFEVICEKHNLEDNISYSSFKRFVKANDVVIKPQKTTCRIEVEPGKEVQIDYGYMGLLYDPLLARNRKIYAFIATLSHSRHMFVEFNYRQTQQSFIASHVRMFEYFGGVVERIVIDNLKAGVLKPDLYDPKLNRAYSEMAEHYNCFIDPCRVGHAKDKGKVENQVPVVRQQFRKQLALNSKSDITSANEGVINWCLGKHGHRTHGTTQWQPFPVFLKVEKPVLKPLPEESFEIPLWKKAKIHVDLYIQFDKKAYSAPEKYRGKTVWVKGTERLVQIYYENRLIQQHVKNNKLFRHTDYSNFPENFQAVLNLGLHKHIIQKASQTGYYFGQMIKNLLETHAFINFRKAQGIVAFTKKYDFEILEEAAEIVIKNHLTIFPKSFKKILENLEDKKQQNNQIKISKKTNEFTREMDYFIH